MKNPLPERGLVIRQPWIDRILKGAKTWELRGKPTQVRVEMALIQGGSCLVVGTARVAETKGPLSREALQSAAKQGKIGMDEALAMDYPDTYAWVLEDVKILPEPGPINTPEARSHGCVWIALYRHLSQNLHSSNRNAAHLNIRVVADPPFLQDNELIQRGARDG